MSESTPRTGWKHRERELARRTRAADELANPRGLPARVGRREVPASLFVVVSLLCSSCDASGMASKQRPGVWRSSHCPADALTLVASQGPGNRPGSSTRYSAGASRDRAPQSVGNMIFECSTSGSHRSAENAFAGARDSCINARGSGTKRRRRGQWLHWRSPRCARSGPRSTRHLAACRTGPPSTRAGSASPAGMVVARSTKNAPDRARSCGASCAELGG